VRANASCLNILQNFILAAIQFSHIQYLQIMLELTRLYSWAAEVHYYLDVFCWSLSFWLSHFSVLLKQIGWSRTLT